MTEIRVLDMVLSLIDRAKRAGLTDLVVVLGSVELAFLEDECYPCGIPQLPPRYYSPQYRSVLAGYTFMGYPVEASTRRGIRVRGRYRPVSP